MRQLRHLPGLALASALLVAPAVAQPTGPLPRARALIVGGQPAQAVPILDSLTRAQPDIPQGWGLLGVALIGSGDPARAVPVLERAITFPAIRHNALYNLGLALSLTGRDDEAIARMLEARATNRIDLTQLGTDTHAVRLRRHPRYPELLPAPTEYAAPFVERVRILREWTGSAPGDQFGWVARTLGDVDGDGHDELVTSAPTAGSGAGTVFVYATRTGALLWSVSGTGTDQLGTFIESAGDVNRDGIPDVAAAAVGADYVLLLSGRDGTVLRRLDARQPGEQFGRQVAPAGDQNGDGYADLLVGAPLNDAAGADAGRAYLVSGRDGSDLFVFTGEAAGHRFGEAVGGSVARSTRLLLVGAPGVPTGGRVYIFDGAAARAVRTIDSESTSVNLGGMFLSVVGDVDGDGVLDTYASDFHDRSRGPMTGRVHVHSGATGRPLLTLTGEGAGQGFGIGAANAGDINRDGRDDLVVGAWQFAGVAASGGKVYLYSGADGSLLGTATGRVMGETLGFDATGIGDVDGDGVRDLLVTSAWSAIRGARSGRVFVLSGADLLRTAPSR